MVIVRLWGGLGNQMFQYACGYAIAKRNNEELLLDTRFFTNGFLSKNLHFSKQRLNILEFPLAFKEQVNRSGEYKFIEFMQQRSISRILRLPTRFSIRADNGLMYVKETRLTFLPYINTLKKSNLYLDGYWQTEKYFQEFKDELRKQFSLNSAIAKGYSENNNLSDDKTVAIHLRMGDYETKKKKLVQYNHIINPKYYEDAITLMKREIENPRFYVFSNQIEQARELLGDSAEYIYVNEDRKMNDVEEFEVMSLCSNHIISNSTFSWWAAWLSTNDKCITIAPDIFFGNEKIVPDGWVKVIIKE